MLLVISDQLFLKTLIIFDLFFSNKWRFNPIFSLNKVNSLFSVLIPPILLMFYTNLFLIKIYTQLFQWTIFFYLDSIFHVSSSRYRT